MTQNLWAPWRMEFIGKAHQNSGGCIFCALPKKKPNPKTLVLFTNKIAFVIMNRFPYTNGHLMVVPRRHVGSFDKLINQEHQELGNLLGQCLKVLQKALKPQGYNIGMNLGKVAGAGIKNHLHYHLVPRWVGDTNFMPVFADVRTLPEHLVETYKKLKRYF